MVDGPDLDVPLDGGGEADDVARHHVVCHHAGVRVLDHVLRHLNSPPVHPSAVAPFILSPHTRLTRMQLVPWAHLARAVLEAWATSRTFRSAPKPPPASSPEPLPAFLLGAAAKEERGRAASLGQRRGVQEERPGGAASPESG